MKEFMEPKMEILVLEAVDILSASVDDGLRWDTEEDMG